MRRKVLSITGLAAAAALTLSILHCAQRTPETRRTLPSYYQPPPPVAQPAASSSSASSASISTTSADDTGLPAPSARDACGNAPGQLFPPDAPWNRSIATAKLAPDSADVIAYLESGHKTRARFRVDFSFTLLPADAATPRMRFIPSPDHYSPDCDITPLPIVPAGRIEGERGYECTSDGDCHLLVIDRSACRLYEMWRANIVQSRFDGGCLAVWNLREPYAAGERGDQCSSSDAAGLPIAPLLFTADELEYGEIAHALRFILPNEMIRQRVYVSPATHSTTATQGERRAPPYGARLRLRADVDLKRLEPAAQVVARALQNYGMILADGGNVTFTALDDEFSTARYKDVGFEPGDLTALRWADFEVVDAGPTRQWTGNCTRTAVVE